ncbi:MAG: DUF2996 domain-containing protein [Leptolyngbyaceae cyanobacterium]
MAEDNTAQPAQKADSTENTDSIEKASDTDKTDSAPKAEAAEKTDSTEKAASAEKTDGAPKAETAKKDNSAEKADSTEKAETAEKDDSAEKAAAAKKAEAAKKAAAAKKADSKSDSDAKAKKKKKPPKIEDKPFGEFIEEHFVPALDEALKSDGWEGVTLSLVDEPLLVKGADDQESYWQLHGDHPSNLDHRFSIVFGEEDIKGPKYFYYSQGDRLASTVEQFMGDERRISLELMVLYTLQRLKGQKWLTRN